MAVANQIAEKLATENPQKASEYRSRAKEFARRTQTVQQDDRTAGLIDKTPAGFASAIEQDTDPAAVDVAAILDLKTSGDIAVLV